MKFFNCPVVWSPAIPSMVIHSRSWIFLRTDSVIGPKLLSTARVNNLVLFINSCSLPTLGPVHPFFNQLFGQFIILSSLFAPVTGASVLEI